MKNTHPYVVDLLNVYKAPDAFESAVLNWAAIEKHINSQVPNDLKSWLEFYCGPQGNKILNNTYDLIRFWDSTKEMWKANLTLASEFRDWSGPTFLEHDNLIPCFGDDDFVIAFEATSNDEAATCWAADLSLGWSPLYCVKESPIRAITAFAQEAAHYSSFSNPFGVLNFGSNSYAAGKGLLTNEVYDSDELITISTYQTVDHYTEETGDSLIPGVPLN